MNFFQRWIFPVNKYFFWITAGGMVLSILLPYQYPASYEIQEELQRDPIQIESENKDRFTYVQTEDNEIYVEPLYDYEVWGLVLSDNGSYSWWNQIFPEILGARVKDLCVAWGTNVEDLEKLKKLKFWNTNYICYYQTRDNDAYRWFDGTKMSNNHLITSSEKVRKAILSAHKGDQIYIKGSLVEYGDAKTNTVGRISSLVRNDTGNGACETIYVEEVEILKRSSHLKYFLKNIVVPLFWLSFLLKVFQGMYYLHKVSAPRRPKQ